MNEYYEYMSKYYDLLSFAFGYKKEELLKNAKGIKVIQYGDFEFSYFNICFVNDMLLQILEVLYEGYIPRVVLADRKEGWIDWADYFMQPFYEFDQTYINELPVVYLDKRMDTSWAGLRYEACFNEQERALATKIYKDWVVINDHAFSYIQKEWKQLIQGKRVLGVLYRGTDMVGSRLEGHPIQPSVEQMITDTKEMMKRLDCEYIYLATEEKRVVIMFQNEFPGKVLVNIREYIDDEYYSKYKENRKIMITELMQPEVEHFYQKGLQYLSSIVLLSQCNGFIAGNCGGSEAALYMNEFGYEDYLIYNLGLYS